MFEVKITGADAFKFKNELGALNKALVSTLNKTAAKGKTYASKIIRETLPLKASEVSERLKVIKSRKIEDAAFLVATGKRIPFISFPVRTFTKRTSKGRRQGVKVNTTGTFQTVEGGFLAIMPSGHIGVFHRRKSAATATGAKKNRLPIKELFGNSLKAKFGSDLIQSRLVPFVEQEGVRIFESEFKFFQSKIKGA